MKLTNYCVTSVFFWWSCSQYPARERWWKFEQVWETKKTCSLQYMRPGAWGLKQERVATVTLLLRTTRMHCQRFGGVRGVAAHWNKQETSSHNLWHTYTAVCVLEIFRRVSGVAGLQTNKQTSHLQSRCVVRKHKLVRINSAIYRATAQLVYVYILCTYGVSWCPPTFARHPLPTLHATHQGSNDSWLPIRRPRPSRH